MTTFEVSGGFRRITPSRRLTTLDAPSFWIAAAAAAIGGIFAVAAYEVGPLPALAGLAASCVVIVVLIKPIAGIYAALLAVPLEVAQTHFGSAFSLTPTKALMLLTAVAVGARLLVSPTRFGFHHAHVAFAGMLAVIALGISVALDPLTTGKILVVWLAVWLASVWVSRASRDEVTMVMLCIAISGAALGILALLGTGPQSLQQGGAVATNRATGSFTSPNQLGAYMVLALPLTIVLAAEKRGLLRAVLLVAIGLDIAGLTLTLARAAIIGAIVAGLVLLAWPSYRRVVLAGLAVVLVLAVVNPKVVQNKEVQTVATRLETVQSFSSASGGRLEVWSATPGIIADHALIGIGEGNFPLYSARSGVLDVNAVPFDHAHNVVLTVAAETGLLGLAFFLWFCGASAIAGLRTAFRADSSTAKLALALLAAYAGTAVISIADYPLGENADFSAIMIEAGLLIALSRQWLMRDRTVGHRESGVPHVP